MATCLHCQAAIRDGAISCGNCGRLLVGGVPSGFAVPLPAPMTEPIRTPTKAPGDAQRPALLVPLDEKSVSVAPASRARTGQADHPLTTPDPPADAFATYDGHASNGTAPALPGLPGHSMNDSALQAPPNTVPATSPADGSPHAAAPDTLVRPKLVVLRGMRVDAEYPIYEGRNTVGRFADKPVDIDLVSQESVEQIWCSRQHAVVTFDKGVLVVEDLNSLNGTWVNGVRIHAGQLRQLQSGDVLQVGTVQMKLVID